MPLEEPALRLTREQWRAMVAHCLDGLPNEGCGLLSGPYGAGLQPTGLVNGIHPCRNADASARTYTVDGRDYLQTSIAASARGDEIIGVFHSHTHTDAYPSRTDVEKATDPAWFYVICSLAAGDAVVRAYRIRGGEISESPVALDD